MRFVAGLMIVAAAAAVGQEALGEREALSVSAEKQGLLEIRTPANLRCSIKVITHPAKRVDVSYEKWAKAQSPSQEKRFTDLIEVHLDQAEGSKTRLRVLAPTMAPWEGTDYSAGLMLEVRVPTGSSTTCHSYYSSIELTGPLSTVEVHNDYGSITARDIDDELLIRASYAPVDCSRIKGSISVETRYASIAGEDLTITEGVGTFETSHGAVRLSQVTGPIEITTSYSPINIRDIDAKAGSVVLSTSYAPIQADNISGELICETSYNPIDLNDITLSHGRSRIETQYSPVTASLTQLGKSSQLFVNNTYSSIDLLVESDLSATLVLTVDDGGSIHTKDIKIKPQTMDKNRLVGLAGDGLSRVEVNVDGIGEINIHGK